MSETRTIRLRVKAEFDDKASQERVLDVTVEGGAELPAEQSLRLTVPGVRDDAGALDDLCAALTREIDHVLGEATPVSNLDDEIVHTAKGMLRLIGGAASELQWENFQRFEEHPRRDEAVATLQAYLAMIGPGLDDDTLGTHWGINVFPSPRTLLRVNVGIVEVLALRVKDPVLVYFQGEQPSVMPPFADEMLDGLKTAQPNYTLTIPFDRLAEAFADESLAAAARARVEAVWRPLPKSNFHNPLCEGLRR